jgi:predicted Zn-dependent protease
VSALTRRGVLGGAGACVLCGGTAAARIAPATMQPLIGENYRPSDADERGIWQSCGRLEEELRTSNLLLDAPAMQAYVAAVMTRLLGNRVRELRIFIVRDASFNAAMWPNGMTIINTGLFIRMRSEAQLAAVLGHEAGHYLRRHSVAKQRNDERKTAVMAFVSAGAGAAAGVAAAYGGNGRSWISLANSINSGLYASLFSFSREQEAEADAFGLRLMVEAGYPPEAAAEVWRQQIEEDRAAAAARSRHYRSHASPVSTHPPDAVRLVDLTASAHDFPTPPPRPYRDGRAEWARVLAPLRATLLDDQVRQNDPGASLYLVTALAAGGWDATLRFYEGETYRLRDAPGDAALAATAYAAAVALPDCPAEAWRANGYALLKAGRADDGRRSLATYLDRAPQATDAAMVRFSLAQ